MDNTTVENKLPEDFKKRWVEALRSGEYKQGKCQLYNKRTDTYCCIGVYAAVNNIRLSYEGLEMIDASGKPNGYKPLRMLLSQGVVYDLWNMNDTEGKSFSEIADYIEKNL